MNSLTLAIASICSRPMHSVLCMVAVAAGITLLCAVFLFSHSVADGFSRNARNIDIVVGTKGSPLQMVLSSVYHADIPPGNITMKDYDDLKRSPNIRRAIPLALGDNYKGFRMVGSTADYLNLYDAEFQDGKVFSASFETVAGANTGLKVGEKIAVSHGFSANSDDVHDSKLYTITGTLKSTGTVLDKLLITPLESVQQLHSAHHHHHHEGAEHHHHEDGEKSDLGEQITSVLLQVRSPVDLMNLPRRINESSNMMAAVPSYEMARFIKSLGIGRQLIVIAGVAFVVLSALILWATLSSGLALRRYDLAVLRVLGASPWQLSGTVIAEATLISGTGAVIGVILGHLVTLSTILSIESLNGLVLAENILMPQLMDAGFIVLGLLAGICASIVPSLSAGRTDVAELLSRGRV